MTYIVVSSNEIVKAEMERPVFPSSDDVVDENIDGTFKERLMDHLPLMENYEAHLASLPRIPAPGHKWKLWDEVVEGKDFRFGQTDCKLGREGCICFPYLEKWCSDAIYIAIPIQPTPECNHEPLIDTGIGYYHCPACKQGWTYEEWRSKQPTPEGEKEKCNGNCGMSYCDEYGCIENKPKGDVSHLLTPLEELKLDSNTIRLIERLKELQPYHINPYNLGDEGEVSAIIDKLANLLTNDNNQTP